MLHSHMRRFTVVGVAALITAIPPLSGADHGPVFGLATPTNPQGGWSLDLGVNGRGGTGGVSSALEAELGYGVTQNIKLTVSGPLVFEHDPYRPQSWRTDYPRWDWRIFGEFTGERAGTLKRQMIDLGGSQANQMFLGPSVLGVYRAIGIEAGIQFPVYRDAGPLFPKEHYRFAVNFAYFF